MRLRCEASAASAKISSGGVALYEYVLMPVTTNCNFFPALSTTYTLSPTLRFPRCLKTPASARPLSTCPSMTAVPTCPGAGPFLYQATSVKFDGVPSAPFVLMPTYCTPALVPSEGISKRYGSIGDGGGAIVCAELVLSPRLEAM